MSEQHPAARVYSSEEERQIIVLGSKAAGWRDRIDWRKAREGRDLGDCNLDCDACYRSRLFSLGLEVLRAAHAPAAATNPKQGYTRRPWWRRYTIQSYRLWKLAYRIGLTKEPW